jgi:hypothetical protein
MRQMQGEDEMKLPRRQMQMLLRKNVGAPKRARYLPAIIASVATFLITVFSFGFSAVGFWASIRKVDDVRVIIGNTPVIGLDGTNIAITGVPKLSFINLGNRPAGITSIEAIGWLFTAADPTEKDCENKEGRLTFEFDTKPFVIDAGKIQLIEPAIQPSRFVKKISDEFYETSGLRYESGQRILLCLAVTLVTPESVLDRWLQPVYLIEFQESQGNIKLLFDEKKPIKVQPFEARKNSEKTT